MNINEIFQDSAIRAQLMNNAEFEKQLKSILYIALAVIGSSNNGVIDYDVLQGISKIPDPDSNNIPDQNSLSLLSDALLSNIKKNNENALRIANIAIRWVTTPESTGIVTYMCDTCGIPRIDPDKFEQMIFDASRHIKPIEATLKAVSNVIVDFSRHNIIADFSPTGYFDESNNIITEFTYTYLNAEHSGKLYISDDKIIIYIDGTVSKEIGINEQNTSIINDVNSAIRINRKPHAVNGSASNILELCHYMNLFMKQADENNIGSSDPIKSVPSDIKDTVTTLAKKIMSRKEWTVMNQHGESGDIVISGEDNDTVTISVPNEPGSKPTIRCVIKGHGYTWSNPNGMTLSQATPEQWTMFAIGSYAKTRILVGNTHSEDLPHGITNSPDTSMFDPQMWLIAGKGEYKQINMKSDAIQAITSPQKTPSDKRLAKEWYMRIRSGFATINFGNVFLNSFRKMPIKILKSIFNKETRIRVARCPLYTTGKTHGNQLSVENYTGGKASVGTKYLSTYYTCIKAKSGTGWVFNPISMNGKAIEQVYASTIKNGDITLIISRIQDDRLTIQLIPNSDAEVLFTDQYGEL